MKYLFGLALAMLFMTSCSEPGTYTEDSDVKTVKTEFINPTDDTLYARVFAEEGWIINTPVPPRSSVIEDVEEGLYSVAAFNTAGEMGEFYPSGMDAENLEDTLNFGLTTDPEDGSKSVRYNFRSRMFRDMFEGRHAFDLSFDKSHIYPVADLQWMYGVDDDSKMRAEFMKVTQQGKKFILSNRSGDQFMIFPDKCAGPFDPIPEEMTVYYNTKHVFPKVFMLPEDVVASDAGNYLVSVLILDQEFESATDTE